MAIARSVAGGGIFGVTKATARSSQSVMTSAASGPGMMQMNPIAQAAVDAAVDVADDMLAMPMSSRCCSAQGEAYSGAISVDIHFRPMLSANGPISLSLGRIRHGMM